MTGPAALSIINRTGNEGHSVHRRICSMGPILLTLGALVFMGLFLLIPIGAVFSYAFREGSRAFWASVTDPDALSAVRLTFFVACMAVPLNLVFGICAAWSVSKFHFPGKNLLITLIDIPFTVSPVIAGLVFVLIFNPSGKLGGWLAGHGIRVLFAVPSIVLATAFVTFPFVAREVIPLMQSQGTDDEEAALMLGAGPIKTFTRVTLPNIRWGLLYGVILCTARAVGEFGAVSVVSGHIRGKTVTMPLQVEILYNEYNFTAAFAMASLLSVISLVTLTAKKITERRRRALEADFHGSPDDAKGEDHVRDPYLRGR